jgi:hypothetical protein
MATFIHIIDERMARRIRRGGIRATEFANRQDAAAPRRGVSCVPVVANFQMTFQWLRELKRRGHRYSCGIQFRIDDTETVYIGHYNQMPQRMTAAQSIAFYLDAEDPRGLQVIVPRAIAAREITGFRSVPQVTGWRFYPAAKGNPPLWPFAGDKNASKVRRRIEQRNRSPWTL